MPITFLTSYHLLKTRGQMQPGDTVLIQAGASGVGTVAIQLAKEWGARVVATASTQDKLDLCRSLGADVTINYTEADFEDEVRDLTDGRGVALVLECVGGPVLEKSVRCVASYGRVVSYGNASGQPANLTAADITTLNRTVIGFSMGRFAHRLPGPPGRDERPHPHDHGRKAQVDRRPRHADVGGGQRPSAPGLARHPGQGHPDPVTSAAERYAAVHDAALAAGRFADHRRRADHWADLADLFRLDPHRPWDQNLRAHRGLPATNATSCWTWAAGLAACPCRWPGRCERSPWWSRPQVCAANSSHRVTRPA